MINKLFRLTAKILGKPIDHQKYMHKGVVLCPAEEQLSPPAIYIDSHLNRIKGIPATSSKEREYCYLHQRTAKHSPTILYSIGSSILFRGGLWTGKREVMLRRLNEGDSRYKFDLKQAVLTDSDIANQYFGHWVHDVMPASLIGTAEMPSLAFKKPHYPHAVDYHHLLDLNTIYGNQGEVRNLYLLSDFSQNSHKIKRYLEIRKRIKEKLNPVDSDYQGIYIARGTTGVKRMLSNEQVLIEHLVKRGFDIVYPEQMSVEMLIRKLWNVPLVISVEGSALAHAIYSIALNGAYLVLQPYFRVTHIHKGICDAMNRPYGFYVCPPSNEVGSFVIDSMADLDSMIDRLHDESGNRNASN
ncbi:MAG: glycosyltransferase family 61 protein [Pseudomonadota bacterium]